MTACHAHCIKAVATSDNERGVRMRCRWDCTSAGYVFGHTAARGDNIDFNHGYNLHTRFVWWVRQGHINDNGFQYKGMRFERQAKFYASWQRLGHEPWG